jgi:uncharacterized membrane protein
MTNSDTISSSKLASSRRSRNAKLIVHALLVIFALVLALIIGGLIFKYQPDPAYYFLLSFVLFVFVFAQSFYEFGGRRTMQFLVISSLIGFGFEVLGTSTGFLFGKYSYSGLLGDKVLGVPVVVPLAWFVITYVTFSQVLPKYFRPSANAIMQKQNLAFSQFRFRAFALPILVSAFGTVAWDFLIDPMFSNLKPPYWKWDITSSTPQIYDVPLSNFVGWFVVALLVLTAFSLSLKLENNKTGDRTEPLFRKNTGDSRIVYVLLMIDGAVTNTTLGQNLAVVIGVVAMSAFLLITFIPHRNEKKGTIKEENSV